MENFEIRSKCYEIAHRFEELTLITTSSRSRSINIFHHIIKQIIKLVKSLRIRVLALFLFSRRRGGGKKELGVFIKEERDRE